MNAILDTIRMILDVFSGQGMRSNQGLSMRDLRLKKHEWDRRHRDNFEKAIVLMMETGLVEWGEDDTLILTETGYNALTP